MNHRYHAMRRRLKFTSCAFVAIVISVICVSVFAEEPTPPPAKPPQGGGDCATCHINWISDFQKRNTEFLVKYEDTIITASGRQNITSTRRMCFTCHDGYVNDSRFQFRKGAHEHPVGVIPSDKIKILKTKNGSKYPLNEDGKLYCGTCHSAHGQDWNRHKSAIFMRSKNINSSMCIDCHQDHTGDNQENHPLPRKVNKKSKNILKAGGKYGEKNRVICQTCHKNHNSSGKNLLIMKNTKRSSLCINCHKDKKQLLKSDHNITRKHKQYTNSKEQKVSDAGPCAACHISHGGHGKPLLATIKPEGETDAWSQCLSCHRNEGIAGEASIGRYSHPTGVAIIDAGIKVVNGKWSSEKRSRRKLKRLPLYDEQGRSVQNDGIVQCPTCHDPHQSSRSNKQFLRLQAGKNSRLCTNCHVKETSVFDSKHNLNLYKGKKRKKMARHNKKLNGVCGSCHNAHNGKTGKILNVAASGRKKSASDMTSFCVSCHDKGKAASDTQIGKHSHPVSVQLSENMEHGDLPLFSKQGESIEDIDPDLEFEAEEKTESRLLSLLDIVEELDEEPIEKSHVNNKNVGYVDCATCHNVHQWDPKNRGTKTGRNTKKSGNSSNSFLRLTTKGDSPLCVTCHQQQSLVIGTDHDMRVTAKQSFKKSKQKIKTVGVCAQCHAAHNSTSTGTLWSKRKPTPNKKHDEQSSLCISCHQDSKAAKNKLVPIGKHPSDVVAWPTPKRSIPQGTTVERTPVFNKSGVSSDQGSVSCPSCHDPHIWQASRARKGNGKNREGNLKNSFLRNKNIANMMCADCHGLDAIFRYQYYHSEKSTVKHSLYID